MSYPPQQPHPHGYGQPPYGHQHVQPAKRNRTGLILAIVVGVPALLLASCTAMFIVVDASKPRVKPDAASLTIVSPDAARAEKPGRDDHADPEPAAKRAGAGDVVSDGKFAFKVTKMATAGEVGDQYLNKRAQGEFVIVYVTVKNIGDQAQAFSGSEQKLYDAGGKQYSADSSAAVYMRESKSLYEQINPGNQVDGVVLFDVPKGTRIKSIELHDSMFSGGATVSLA